MDQPAPPDVAAGARATGCCSSSRWACAGRSSPAGTCGASSGGCAAGWRRRATADGVHVLSPLVLPLHSHRRRARAQRAAAAVARGARGAAAGPAPAASCGPTSRRPRCCSTRSIPSLVVYHCVDDIAAQEGVDADSFRAAERRFAAARRPRARQRAGRSPSGMRTLSDNVLYAPNVADTALFSHGAGARAGRPRARRAARARGSSSPARSWQRSSTSSCSGRWPHAHRDWTFALVGPGGRRRPGHRRRRRSARSPTSTCSAARRYDDAARGPARRRRRR